MLATLVAHPMAARAQANAIPGRDLLSFPLARTAEPAALATLAGTGLWNPASALVPDSSRWRLVAAAMNAPADVAVSAEVLTVAFGGWRHTTFAFTLVTSSVGGIARTESDPQSVGPDVTYSTTVYSLIAAQQVTRHIAVGIALRDRYGRLDALHRHGLSLDIGAVADHLSPLDLRLGASTFLLHPGGRGAERASLLAAADLRVLGSDSTRTVRAGYGIEQTDGLSTEHFLYASGRWSAWELRGGPVRTTTFGETNVRLRVGIGVRHAGYSVGVAREEGVNGLAPTYQFSLSSLIR